MNNKFKLILSGLVLLSLGVGVGYYFMPDKLKIEYKEKIVYKTKVKKEESKKVTEKFDSNTGKVVERIVETGKKETITDSIKNEKEKKVEKARTKKMYAIKVGAASPVKNIDSYYPRVGAEIRLPVFNSWAGVEADIDINRPTIGIYMRLEF